MNLSINKSDDQYFYSGYQDKQNSKNEYSTKNYIKYKLTKSILFGLSKTSLVFQAIYFSYVTEHEQNKAKYKKSMDVNIINEKSPLLSIIKESISIPNQTLNESFKVSTTEIQNEQLSVKESMTVLDQVLNKSFEPSTAKIQDEQLSVQASNQTKGIITYTKGLTPTKNVVRTNKEVIIGKGKTGSVYELKDNPQRVIKRTEGSISAPNYEYEIGAKLNHPNLVKIHQLYVKNYPDSEISIHKLEMDKIEGNVITNFYQTSTKLSDEEVKKLIAQAKDCCLYLFKNQVAWVDVNDGNIFMTSKDKNLMLCDFGYWKQEDNPKQCAKFLLIGAMEIMCWVIKSSNVRANRYSLNRALENTILFPKAFFQESVPESHIYSFLASTYDNRAWMKNIQQQLETMNEEDMENFLGGYFDQVLTAFSSRPQN